MSDGIIFNVQRYSLHDGPGIRSTVFLKGCPLRCAWCHNPESMMREPEPVFSSGRCIGTTECNACRRVCPTSLRSGECIRCGRCANICPTGAREWIGRRISPHQLLDEVRRDHVLYRSSGGGVTLSGGEPLMQPEFTHEVIEILRKHDMHVAIDTCGYATELVSLDVLPRVNLVLYDLKSVDDARHRRWTGVSCEPIVRNFRRLLEHTAEHETGPEMWIRIPIVPGFNADRESLTAIAEFVDDSLSRIAADRRDQARRTIGRVTLLPYHRFGTGKSCRLRRQQGTMPMEMDISPDTATLSPESLRTLADAIFAPRQLTVEINGERNGGSEEK